MKIIFEQDKYHRYAFDFNFSYPILESCRKIKEAYGWQAFTFFNGKWRFSDPIIANIIQAYYPEVIIDNEELKSKMSLAKDAAILNAEKERKIEEVKQKTDTDFVVNNIKLPLYGYQKVAVEFFEHTNGRAICAADCGTGKCFRGGTKILMFDGTIKNIEDIFVGEKVMGDDSTPRKVLGLSRGTEKMYKIIPIKGEPFVINKNHLLCLQNAGGKIDNIAIENYLLLSKYSRYKYNKKLFRVGVDFAEQKVRLDPYFLGIWLADGTSTTSEITNPDKEIISFLRNFALQHKLQFKQKEQRLGKCPVWALNNGKKGIHKGFNIIRILRSYNLFSNKHIPQEYKINSQYNRLQLLAGILDGDGSESCGGFDYLSVRRQLAEDVVFLCRSLGLAAYMKKCKKGIKSINFVGTYYRVSISGDCSIIPTKIKRKQAHKRIQIKSVLRTGFKVKSLGREKYYGIAIDGNHRHLLADFTVVHNTLMSLAYVAHNEFVRTLVICPASVRLSWDREVKKWTDKKSFVITSQTLIEDIPVADIYIINYDILKKFADFLLEMRFNCLIIDESQMIKGASQRTNNVKKIAKNIEHVLCLSGSPLINRPIDLFNQLNVVDPLKWHNWMAFAKRFCKARKTFWGLDVSGSSNIEELKSVISKHFIRFRKEDVLAALPPKVFIPVPTELNGYKKDYDYAMENLVNYLIEMKEKTIDEAEKSMSAKAIVLLNELRQITTRCKAESAKELIENITESGEKVIVFSMFVQPLKDLHEQFKETSVLLIGETSMDDRQAAIDKFQSNDSVKIFFGGTKSAGVGITLTEASNVLFVDSPWTYSDLFQAYSRAERIGNTASRIKIYEMMCAGTIDEKISDLVASKKALFDKIFNDGVMTGESGNVTGELINLIKVENNI